MARVRWTGDGDRQVMVEIEDRVEQVDFPRMEWVDVPYDTARSLARQDGWELEAARKAARTRAASEPEADKQPVTTPETDTGTAGATKE